MSTECQLWFLCKCCNISKSCDTQCTFPFLVRHHELKATVEHLICSMLWVKFIILVKVDGHKNKPFIVSKTFPFLRMCFDRTWSNFENWIWWDNNHFRDLDFTFQVIGQLFGCTNLKQCSCPQGSYRILRYTGMCIPERMGITGMVSVIVMTFSAREVNKNNLLGGQFLIFLPKKLGKLINWVGSFRLLSAHT